MSTCEFVVGEAKMTKIFARLPSRQVSCRNICSNAVVNSLDDTVSPCRNALLMSFLF